MSPLWLLVTFAAGYVTAWLFARYFSPAESTTPITELLESYTATLTPDDFAAALLPWDDEDDGSWQYWAEAAWAEFTEEDLTIVPPAITTPDESTTWLPPDNDSTTWSALADADESPWPTDPVITRYPARRNTRTVRARMVSDLTESTALDEALEALHAEHPDAS